MGRRRKYCSAQPYLDHIGVSEKDRKEEKSMSKMKIRVVLDFTVDEKETDYRGEELLKIVREELERAFIEDPDMWELKDIKFVEEEKK